MSGDIAGRRKVRDEHSRTMRRSPFLLFEPSVDLENSSSKEDSEEGMAAGGASNNFGDPRQREPYLVPNRGNRMKLGKGPFDDDSSLNTGPVTYEWLTQAEDARLHGGATDAFQSIANSSKTPSRENSGRRNGGLSSSVIQEFYFWRRKPELAEAVAAIKALTAVIKRSEATTMMGLEIDLKEASEALKVELSFQSLPVTIRLFVNSNRSEAIGEIYFSHASIC